MANLLTIVYDKNVRVKGQLLDLKTTFNQPSIHIKRRPLKQYTLIMADPNAKPSDFLHWLIVNIDGDNFSEIVPYYRPTPPSGIHNYIFYYCEQTGPINLKTISGRSGFNTSQFILDNRLTVLERKSFKVRAGF